jgi:hypothetical protein
MGHFQQTYMALVQVRRISDLLNNKPFINSSKTTINVSTCALQQIDKLRRAFVWAGDVNVAGGRCRVA